MHAVDAPFTRKAYMMAGNGLTGAELREAQTEAHRRYYGQFVTPEIRSFVETMIGRRVILSSQDEHFNDIPLRVWDRLPCGWESIRILKARVDPGFGVSIADAVCIYKEAARQIREDAESQL